MRIVAAMIAVGRVAAVVREGVAAMRAMGRVAAMGGMGGVGEVRSLLMPN